MLLGVQAGKRRNGIFIADPGKPGAESGPPGFSYGAGAAVHVQRGGAGCGTIFDVLEPIFRKIIGFIIWIMIYPRYSFRGLKLNI